MRGRVSGRIVAAVAALIALITLTSVLSSRSQSDPDGPSGILALRRLLKAMGADVGDATDPPRSGTYVVVADLRTPVQDEELLEWVRAGGRLVVGDMSSALVPLAGFGEAAEATDQPAGCAAAEAAGVSRIETGGVTVAVTGDGPAAISCFDGGFAARTLGRGRVVVAPDLALFQNEYLRRADNARLAVQTFGPGPITFGAPLPSGAILEGRGVWASLPLAAKAVVIQLMLAVAAFALMRARRLGKPLIEHSASPIPAGELVRATADLYRSARQPGHAAALMRQAMRTRLGRRVGVVPEALEGAPPSSDAELLAVSRQIEQMRRDIEGADR